MKNKLATIIALLVLTITLQAQTIKQSLGNKVETGGGGTAFTLYNEGSVYVLRFSQRFQNVDITLEKYNSESLKVDFYKTIKMKDVFLNQSTEKFLIGLYLLNNKVHVIFYEQAAKKDNFMYNLYEVDNVGEFDLKTKLAEFEVVPGKLKEVLTYAALFPRVDEGIIETND